MPMPMRTLTALAAIALVVAACGDDGEPTATATTAPAVTTTSAPPTTVAPPSTTVATPATTAAATSTTSAAATAAFGPEEEAAATAFATALDSGTPFDDKIAVVEDAESVRSTNEAYAAAAQQLGGIAVEPTAVVIAGDVATVTYRVLFGGAEAYAGLTSEVQRTANGWMLPKAGFCSFMASARTPCPA